MITEVIEANLVSTYDGIIKTNLSDLVSGTDRLINPRVKLVKAQIPYTFYPIRAGTNGDNSDATNTIRIYHTDDGELSTTIPEGYYPTVTALLTAMMTAINSVTTTTTFSYTYDTVSGKTTITCSSGAWYFQNTDASTASNFSIDNLFYLLGFEKIVGIGPESASQTSVGVSTISFDTSIEVNSALVNGYDNLSTSRPLKAINTNAFALIPVNCNFGQQINYFSPESVSGWLRCGNLFTTIVLTLSDVFGTPLNLNYKLWTATLAISYDVDSYTS